MELRDVEPAKLEQLVQRLRASPISADRALAALLLPRLSPRAAGQWLLASLEREHDADVLAAAAEALREIDAGFSAQELKRLASQPDPEVRRAVAASLYGADDDAALSALLDLSGDLDDEVRDWAAWALADNYAPSPERDEALLRWLNHTDPDSQLATQVRSAVEESSGPKRAARRGLPTGGDSREYAGIGEVTVLVTSANPLDTDKLALEEEVRDITASLRQTPGRDVVDLRTAWAVRPLDLLIELNEHQPQVLHFSGHGTADGRLVFLDKRGYGKPVDATAIAAALSSAGETVRVVVLNACFTADLAHALTQHIDVAVGMERPVGDEAARVFAQAFYLALGHGSSVARAFDQGCAALMLEGIPEHRTPRLAVKDGVDPEELVLVDRTAVSRPNPIRDRERLQELTARHMDHLAPHATLPIAGGLAIERDFASVLREKAESGSLFVVGSPGSGKTGALYRLATDLLQRGSDVVVLAADLLGAGGPRGLQEELGLDLELVDALAAWRGEGSAFLLIDGLDAARGREAASVLLEAVRRVASREGRWRVVVSIRSFDLRHSPDLQSSIPAQSRDANHHTDDEFALVRHVAVDELLDEELAVVSETAPAVGDFLAHAASELVDLIRTPFNLYLLTTLLDRDAEDADRLYAVRTQLELLNLYWDRRVLAPADGRDARELIAAQVCDLAIDELRLQVSRAGLRKAAAQGAALTELLAEGVLVETRLSGARGDRIGFAHHVLFDYAVHRLVLSGEPEDIAARLAASDDLILLARPSLVLTLVSVWDADPTRTSFWDLALRLASDDVRVAAGLVAPAVFVEHAAKLADAQRLLRSLGRDDRAALVLRHVVGAVAATGLPSRPLANADLHLWARIAEQLASRLSANTVYPVRILTWGLTADIDRLNEDVMTLGVIGRSLLTWLLNNNVASPPDVGVALEAVARTCNTDPAGTRTLLSRVMDPERWRRYGASELMRLTNDLGSLARCLPDLAADLFEVAFSYDEQSDEPTDFGAGQILRLTSTRRQDWGMVRYGLVQEFPELLRADLTASLRALNAAAMHEAGSWSSAEPTRVLTFTTQGNSYEVIEDGSEYWDRPGLQREAVDMLDAFEESVLERSQNGDDGYTYLLEALAGRPWAAAIWRRVIRTGAKTPRSLGAALADVAAEVQVLLSPSLAEPVCRLMSEASAAWSAAEVARAETAILSIPLDFRAEDREQGERIRDGLIGCLPATALQTEEAREVRARVDLSDVSPPPPGPRISVTAGWRELDAEHELQVPGVDSNDPENASVLEAIKAVSEFVRTHLNTPPSSDEIEGVLGDIEALRDLRGALVDRVEPRLLDEAQAWLSEAAAVLASQTPIPEESSIRLARELALDGARGAIPAGQHEDLEQFDRGPWWGSPSGRVAGGRALLLLSRTSDADSEIFDAAEILARDPDPAVRWMVASSLVMAVDTHPEWAWALARRIATEDPSAQVREAVLHTLARFARDRIDDVVDVLRAMYEREEAGTRHPSLLRAVSSLLIELWIWRGNPAGRALVDGWIEDVRSVPDQAREVFFSLRKVVTHGGDSLEDSRVRERATTVWVDLTQAARDAFRELEGLLRSGNALDEQQRETAAALARLLDQSATELYFASGAYAEQHEKADQQLKPDVRSRFYREASSLLDVLATVGIPPAAHHVLETLASYTDTDPRGVLLRVGQVLKAGQAWGYQLEGLAEAEFVQLVERYLASHRDLFLRDRESRAVLLAAVQGFVEAGWPSARRLVYGLDDMFR